MTSDVLVMGGGATGQLAAAYLRMRFPDLNVSVVEGPHKNRPIVGESFVETTIDLLLELGLVLSHRKPLSQVRPHLLLQARDRPSCGSHITSLTRLRPCRRCSP
jgi:2-polyprenyl-6-methoxyphenol hydroxylase-like FAD-dependent oxidoreductase